jgi:hypothetical protein
MPLEPEVHQVHRTYDRQYGMLSTVFVTSGRGRV